MKAEERKIASDQEAHYREVSSCGLTARAWQELYSAKVAAGNDCAGILVVNEVDYPLVVMTKRDLDMLLDPDHGRECA